MPLHFNKLIIQHLRNLSNFLIDFSCISIAGFIHIPCSTIAIASPPPMQRLASPYLALRDFIV